MAFPPYTFRTQGNPLVSPPSGPTTAAAQLDANFAACAAVDWSNVSGATKLALPITTATTAAIAAAIAGLATVARSGIYADLTGKPTLGTASTHDVGFFLQTASNLSDLVSPTTALTNLGLSANGKSLVTAANYAAMLGLLGAQPLNANLTAFGALSLVADRLPYANGTGTLALTTFTALGRAVLATSTLTQNGVVLANAAGAFTATAAGTNGQVLTGNTGSAPTFQNPAPAGAWTQLDTITTTSGATAAFAAINPGYSDLMVTFNGVSTNTGGTAQLQVALSNDNGSSHSADVIISGNASAPTVFGGALTVLGYRVGIGQMTSAIAASFTSTLFAALTGGATSAIAYAASGGVDNIRFSWSDTSNFDAGVITLWAR